MRWSRPLFTAFIMSGLLFCATLRPTRAYADWSDVGSTKYICVTNVANSSFYASSLKISPVGTQMSTINTLVPANLTRAYGTLSGVTSSTVIYLVIPVAGGSLQTGKRFLVNAETLDLGFAMFAESKGGSTAQYLSVTNIRYWGRRTTGAFVLLTPDTDGLFTAPYSLEYVIMSFTSPNATALNGQYALSPFGTNVIVQTPDGEPTIEGYIQDQTEELKSTEGSNGIASGTVTNTTNQLENITLGQQIGQIAEQLTSAVNTQETDAVVPFPGLSLAGFSIPAQDVNVIQYVPSDILEHIRWITTFIFSAAFIAHMVSLFNALFGVWEYGANAEMFGEGNYDMGPRVTEWRGDSFLDDM